MTLYCSQGHLNPSDNRFCRLCGEVLSVSHAAIAGQLLAWRYKVKSELGQGGFGRTYLAEDTNRFNEACVLKEFAPQNEGQQALQKAEELFAREAGILYQLEHPQIPRFREIFRAEWQGRERIFLVQDYVAGQTYHDLLQQRLQQGDRFSEPEVVQLLLQLLPVLDYIHSAGVIHRDISPDNLIQRSSDGLAVLIDFGGVKQVAAKVVSETSPVAQPRPVTRLGKIGYAPAEQLELGEVYPHSDLYALAVTALVLLTGKEPADLFSRNGVLDRNQWRQEVRLRPALTSVLAKMLEPYPAKRYQSAPEVMQALTTTGHRATQPVPPASLHSGEPIPVFSPDPATIAVSPRPVPQPASVTPKPSRPRRKGLVRTITTTLLLAGLIGGGWWAGVKWIGPALKAQLPEITKPSKPKPSTKPEQPQQSNFSRREQERKQQIDARRQQLGIDQAFLVSLVNEAFYTKHPELNGQKLGTGNEDANLRKEWDELALDYLKRLESLSPESRSRLGQFTQADLQERQTAVSEINLSGRALNDLTDAAFFHQFPEQPKGGNLLDQPIGQVWQGIATDQLQLLQSGKTLQRVQFPPGNFSDRLTGSLQPGEGKAYIADLSTNQTLQLQLQAAAQSFLLSLYPPTSDQPALLSDSRESAWSGKLNASGYYEIVVVSNGKDVNYAIDLAVADEVNSP